VDNWWIDPIRNKEDKVFLVAALSMDNEAGKKDEIEKLKDISKEIHDLT